MAVTSSILSDTRRAFDSVAAEYDRANAANPILCWMRRQTMAQIAAHVPRGGRILDLGCGPGEDEATLGRAGFHVTAIDWSPAMVEETRKRVAQEDLRAHVDVHQLGIHELDRLPAGSFDAACSNFGPLNCVPDLSQAAQLIAARVRPGGVLIASVIGRFCPWELALFGLGGDWQRMRVRFAKAEVPVPLNGRTVWTTYYSPGAFERMFVDAGFARLSLRALGLFVPPPYNESFARRHPLLIASLERLDEWFGAWPGFRNTGDHFLIVMKKSAN